MTVKSEMMRLCRDVSTREWSVEFRDLLKPSDQNDDKISSDYTYHAREFGALIGGQFAGYVALHFESQEPEFYLRKFYGPLMVKEENLVKFYRLHNTIVGIDSFLVENIVQGYPNLSYLFRMYPEITIHIEGNGNELDRDMLEAVRKEFEESRAYKLFNSVDPRLLKIAREADQYMHAVYLDQQFERTDWQKVLPPEIESFINAVRFDGIDKEYSKFLRAALSIRSMLRSINQLLFQSVIKGKLNTITQNEVFDTDYISNSNGIVKHGYLATQGIIDRDDRIMQVSVVSDVAEIKAMCQVRGMKISFHINEGSMSEIFLDQLNDDLNEYFPLISRE